ncbi:DNA repair protein RadA [Candidatus Saccharibacteria bacterium RAAC3_TM7_1]|nr:DNA repair protein RadA [Candidatus Saccharibacteria bacterium RAAC3_TM7_1]
MVTSEKKIIDVASLDSLMTQYFPTARWTVESIIPEGGLTILSAAPGSFKTWLMLEITLSIAEGRSLFGKYSTNKTGVLFVDEESGPRMLQERFKQLGSVEGLPIHYTSRQNTRVTEAYVESLLVICKEKEIGLVMFDSLVRLHSSDENASKDMSELFNLFRQLTDSGLSVLIAHHNRKPNQGNYNPSGDMRGSSDILAAVDCHMAMSRQNGSEYVLVQQTKNRYMPEIRPFKLRFVLENETSYFEFVGEEKNRSSERADDKQYIVDTLKINESDITKKLLYELLASNGKKIGMNRLGEYLEELIVDELVFTSEGPRTAVYYHIRTDTGVR